MKKNIYSTSVNKINEILLKYGSEVKINVSDILISGNFVGDYASEQRRVSKAIMDITFPSMVEETVFHFTSYGSFKAIFRSGKFRLYNLNKRFKSGEYRTFCRDHGLDGYLRISKNKVEEGAFSEIMPQIFYGSFTPLHTCQQSELWKIFSDDGKGVRIRFKIRTNGKNYNDLRRIHYSNSNFIPVLKDLQDCFKEDGLCFVPARISKFGAFYLRADYSFQDEIRLLVRQHSDDYSFPFQKKVEKGASRIRYIEHDLMLNNNPLFSLEIESVLPGKNCDPRKVKTYLDKFSSIRNCKIETV